MLKNSFILIVLLNLTNSVFAQTDLVFRLDPQEMKSGMIKGTNLPSSVTFYGGAGVQPTLYIRATTPNFVGLTATRTESILPIGSVNVSAIIDGSPYASLPLSTEWNWVWYRHLSIGNWNEVTFSFSVPNVQSFNWLGGVYSTDVELSTGSLGFGSDVTPKRIKLSIDVPKILDLDQSHQPVNLEIDNFEYFRKRYFFREFPKLNFYQTVDYSAFLESKTPVFDFRNGYNGVNPPSVGIDALQISANDGSGFIGRDPIQLAGGSRMIQSSNTSRKFKETMHYTQYSIKPEELKKHFINKGTYSNTLEFSLIPQNPRDNMTAKRLPITVNVVVDDMAELTLNGNNVNLLYEDYDGVSVTMNNHLVVSKTTPYDISVRAGSEYFESRGSDVIPVSVLAIDPGKDTFGVRSIQSLSTTDQTLVSAANPVVDRNISLIYSIPSSKRDIMYEHAVPGGIYSNTVIYTLTGH